jgi:hypothetical protein
MLGKHQMPIVENGIFNLLVLLSVDACYLMMQEKLYLSVAMENGLLLSLLICVSLSKKNVNVLKSLVSQVTTVN